MMLPNCCFHRFLHGLLCNAKEEVREKNVQVLVFAATLTAVVNRLLSLLLADTLFCWHINFVLSFYFLSINVYLVHINACTYTHTRLG